MAILAWCQQQGFQVPSVQEKVPKLQCPSWGHILKVKKIKQIHDQGLIKRPCPPCQPLIIKKKRSYTSYRSKNNFSYFSAWILKFHFSTHQQTIIYIFFKSRLYQFGRIHEILKFSWKSQSMKSDLEHWMCGRDTESKVFNKCLCHISIEKKYHFLSKMRNGKMLRITQSDVS